MPLDDLTNHMSSEASWIVALGLSSAVALWAITMIVGALAELRRSREGAATEAGAAVLREGASVIVGVVETDDAQPAIVVRLHEEGKQWQGRNGARHEWREISREVEVRGFHVVTSQGARVRVEPSSDVVLVDAMEVTAWPSSARRERTARLGAGARVAITGRLSSVGAPSGGAYRGQGASWQLTPTGSGPMIVSERPLGERHAFWAGFFARWAIVPVVLMVVLQVYFFTKHYDFALHGTPGIAHVAQRGRHELRVSFPDGSSRWIVVEAEGLRRAEVGAEVACISTPSGRTMLGSRPGLNPRGCIALTLIAGGLFVGWWLRRRRNREWYEQRPVVTRGEGPLSRPPPHSVA